MVAISPPTRMTNPLQYAPFPSRRAGTPSGHGAKYSSSPCCSRCVAGDTPGTPGGPMGSGSSMGSPGVVVDIVGYPRGSLYRSGPSCSRLTCLLPLDDLG